MLKRILVSGALGFAAMFLWTFVSNAIFGFSNRVEMNRIPNEPEVYRILKENIAAPGAYLANPPLTPDGQFPGSEPVFGVRTSGMGHEAAGRMAFIEPAIGLAAALLAAGLLSMASPWILSRYSRRVLFVVVIGLLVALFTDLAKIGIGGYPVHTGLLLAARDVVSWTLAALAMAGSMRIPGDSAGAA